MPIHPGRNPGAGRPQGSKTRFTSAVWDDLFAVWTEPAIEGGNMSRGREALLAMYEQKPAEYAKLCLSVMPKDIVVESAMSDLSDQELDSLMVRIRDHLATIQKEKENDETAEG